MSTISQIQERLWTAQAKSLLNRAKTWKMTSAIHHPLDITKYSRLKRSVFLPRCTKASFSSICDHDHEYNLFDSSHNLSQLIFGLSPSSLKTHKPTALIFGAIVEMLRGTWNKRTHFHRKGLQILHQRRVPCNRNFYFLCATSKISCTWQIISRERRLFRGSGWNSWKKR